MAKSRNTKSRKSGKAGAELPEQLEQAFLAGLGALSNAQKAGSKAFDKLVDQGKSFRKNTTSRTEALIKDVQGAIRSMESDARSKATGLIDQMRDTPQMEKLQSVFDERVATTLNRMGVASKQDVDALNRKLDKVLAMYEKQQRAPRATKKSAKKAAKKVAKKSATRKAPSKRPAARKVRKKAARKTV
ncbi:MAG: phasin family protein [Woeseiaceae bacterium]|nr:phasin family protein [Woeseiaceae bacterium]